MISSQTASSTKYCQSIAQTCAITFQGNASNQLQQDALYLLDNWYQEALGITETLPFKAPFCLAVSDGVASSNYSQHCSKAVVKAVKSLWANQQILSSDKIHNLLTQTKHSVKRYGAGATMALVVGELNSDGTIIKATITHVGDSRIYRLVKGALEWECLTRDHKLLNELIDEQARAKGQQVKFAEYNREGMAGSLYSITECFALNADIVKEEQNRYCYIIVLLV